MVLIDENNNNNFNLKPLRSSKANIAKQKEKNYKVF